MKKLLTAITLLILLICSTTTYAGGFKDISQNSTFAQEIYFLSDRGIINGYIDGRFGPTDTVTREAAAVMIGRALKLDGTPRKTSYTDVSAGSYSSGYIKSAEQLGIIKGFSDGTFRPKNPVTRGQMAIFIARAFDLKEEQSITFTDVSTSSSAYDSIGKILKAGITQGYEDGRFYPNAVVTRAQFSAFLARALDEKFKVAPPSYSISAFEQKVVNLTNEERSKKGLAPLKVDIQLSKVAREKSADMQKNNYFDHTSPTYGSPFEMMKSFGISYRAAGENIAMGYTSPEAVVTGWMNSPGHRTNILNSNFTHIGIGYVQVEHHWTQMFIGK